MGGRVLPLLKYNSRQSVREVPRRKLPPPVTSWELRGGAQTSAAPRLSHTHIHARARVLLAVFFLKELVYFRCTNNSVLVQWVYIELFTDITDMTVYYIIIIITTIIIY